MTGMLKLACRILNMSETNPNQPPFANWPALRGAALALLAAALFGVSTPLLQRAGGGVGPFATAALAGQLDGGREQSLHLLSGSTVLAAPLEDHAATRP